MVASERVAIRRANADDFDGWFDLFAAVAAEAKWVGGEAPSDRVARRRAFDHYLEAEDAVMLLAEVDAQLVGQLGVEVLRGVAHVGMMVDERWRARGVGSTLMEACINWAKEHRAHKVSLEVWPHNTAAIALYKKFGFDQEGLQRRHYRRRSGQLWDAITMGLVLDWDSPGSPFAGG